MNHREPALHKAGEPLNADKGEGTMHGESVALRHLPRTSVGVHTNPYHLPTTVVQHGVEMTCMPVLVDPHVFANISQAQLLLTQTLAGLYPGQQQ